jgi:hypothetical protein
VTNFDYLYNPTAAKGIFDKDYFIDKKLGFQVIEHGMILPHKVIETKTAVERLGCGGVVRENGEYIKESFIHHGIGGAYTPPQNQLSIAMKP